MTVGAGVGDHWNERARSVEADIEVNLMDLFQRELEYDAVEELLEPGWDVLEVGCGNGYSTERFRYRVASIDAIDIAEAMIERARERVGERNNHFFVDDILAPKAVAGGYDAILCIRVLINLPGFSEQVRALESMSGLLRPGGTLILAEGFTEGFDALAELRREVGLEPLEPAPINYYSSLADLMPEIERHFEVAGSFHLGAYDYLTRVMYPLIAGDEVRHNTVFSEQAAKLARAFNPDAFEHLSRMRGLVLRKAPGGG
jgi:SAM-dependent methyltransferase